MSCENWFEEKEHCPDDVLMQGDFLLSCSFPVFGDTDNVSGIALAEDVPAIVLTQSCDLEQKKVENVIFCACQPLNEYFRNRYDEIKNKKIALGRENNETLAKEIKSEINQELQKMCRIEGINCFILPKIEALDEMYVVNFTDIFSLPYDIAMNFFRNQQQVFRLKSPYRECLSQAFARSFMRVGLDSRVDGQECKALLDEAFEGILSQYHS